MGCPLPVPGEEAPAPGRDLLGLVRSQREKMEIPAGDAKYRLLLALTGLSPKMQLAPGGAEYPAQSALRAAQLSPSRPLPPLWGPRLPATPGPSPGGFGDKSPKRLKKTAAPGRFSIDLVKTQRSCHDHGH